MKLNIVPARTGLTWVKLGIRTFFRQPLALVALFFMYMAVASIATMLPFGFVLAFMIEPAARLGLMAAAREASNERFPMPAVLISAFRAGKERMRAMLVLGVMHAAACGVVLLLASLFTGDASTNPPATPEAQMSLMVPTLLLYMPVSLLFWHAPALVHFHGIAPAKSLFFSLVACLRNWKAMSLFGLGWCAVILAVSMPLSIAAGMASSPQAAMPIVAPILLALAAMFTTSIYFTFRDSFTEDPPPAAIPPAIEPTPGANPGDTP